MGYSLSEHAHAYCEELLIYQPNPWADSEKWGEGDEDDEDSEDFGWDNPRHPNFCKYHDWEIDVEKVEKEIDEFAEWAKEKIELAQDDCPYWMVISVPNFFHVFEDGSWHPDTIQAALIVDNEPSLTPKEYLERDVDIAFRRALKQKREKK
jgi:hypothetical protein